MLLEGTRGRAGQNPSGMASAGVSHSPPAKGTTAHDAAKGRAAVGCLMAAEMFLAEEALAAVADVPVCRGRRARHHGGESRCRTGLCSVSSCIMRVSGWSPRLSVTETAAGEPTTDGRGAAHCHNRYRYRCTTAGLKTS